MKGPGSFDYKWVWEQEQLREQEKMTYAEERAVFELLRVEQPYRSSSIAKDKVDLSPSLSQDRMTRRLEFSVVWQSMSEERLRDEVSLQKVEKPEVVRHRSQTVFLHF